MAGKRSSRVKDDAEMVWSMMLRANQIIGKLSTSYAIKFDLNMDLNQCDEQGMSLLMHAARQGNLALITWLVEDRKVNVNHAPDSKPHYTALHVAAEAGQLDSVNYLLKQGSSLAQAIKSHGDNDDSLFSVLARNNQNKVLNRLLEEYKKNGSVEHWTFYRALTEAIKQNNCDNVVAILKMRAYFLNHTNLLDLAIKSNAHPYIIALLFASDPTWERNDRPYSLELAVQHRNLPATYLLTNCFTLQLGDKTFAATKNDIKWFLHANTLQKAIKIFLENAPMTREDEKIYYLLVKAGAPITKEVQKTLIENQPQHLKAIKPFCINTLFADDVDFRRTLGVKGVVFTYGDAVELLHGSGLCQAEIVDRSKFYSRPKSGVPNFSHMLAKVQNTTAAHLVVQLPGDMTEYPGLKTDNDELAHYYLSFYKPNKPVAKDESQTQIIETSAQTNCFSEFLMSALTQIDQVFLFQKLFNELNELVTNDDAFLTFSHLKSDYNSELDNEWYFDIDAINSDGNNCLTKAIRDKKNKVVKFLLDKNANADFQFPNSECPVLVAAETGNEAALKDLVELGADLTVTNAKKQNAVIIATINKHVVLLDYLHQMNITLNQIDAVGNNALSYATHVDNIEIVDKLLALGAAYDTTLWNVVTEHDSIEVYKYLLEKRPQIIAKFNQHELQYWAVKNSAITILNFIKSSLNLTATDDFGRSLLHISLESTHDTFCVCLKQDIPFNITDNFGNTVFDELAGQTYNFLNQTDNAQDKTHHSMDSANKNKLTDFFRTAPTILSSEELIEHVRKLVYSDKILIKYLNRLCLLLIAEVKSNRLTFSSETKMRLVPLRHYIGAMLINILKCQDSSEMGNWCVNRILHNLNNLTLGQVLDHHDYLPHLYKSTTYETIKELVSFQFVKLSDENQDLPETQRVNSQQ